MPSLVRLQACLVGQAGAAYSSQPGRWKALLASLTLQTVLVAAALLVPLLVGGDSPVFKASRPMLMPAGEPGGTPEVKSSGAPRSAAAADPRKLKLESILRQPPAIPRGVTEFADASPGEAPSLSGVSTPWGVSHGVGTSSVLPAGPVLLIAEPEPPPPSEPEIIRLSSMERGALLERVEPVYPHIAKQMGLEGTVVLRVRIGSDGRVREVEVERGHPILARAAWAAVLAWRFRPTILNGQPVEVETRVVVNFQLHR